MVAIQENIPQISVLDTFVESLYNLEKNRDCNTSYILGSVDIDISPEEHGLDSITITPKSKIKIHTMIEDHQDFCDVYKTKELISTNRFLDYYNDKDISSVEDVKFICQSNPYLKRIDMAYSNLSSRTKVFTVSKEKTKNLGIFDICYCFLKDMQNKGLLKSKFAQEIANIVLITLDFTAKCTGTTRSCKAYVMGNSTSNINASDLYLLLRNQVQIETYNILEFKNISYSTDFQLTPFDIIYMITNFYNKLTHRRVLS